MKSDKEPSRRLERLRSLLSDDIPALVISGVANIRYLLAQPTMFDPGFGGLLFVGARTVVLIADSRYAAQAVAAELVCEVEPMVESAWATLAGVARKAKLKRAGFESRHITVAQWQQLTKLTPIELAPTEGIVEGLRAVKEPSEIDCLAKAAQIADAVFSDVLNMLRPGLTEREIALEIDFKMRRRGAERSSFETIVASGPNSAFPHAGAGERRIELGDFIKLDFGAVYEGYHSDMTRTVVVGRANQRQKETHAAVLGAQAAALDGLAPGMTGAEGDALARNYFKSIGMAGNFGHNLGHGVGLDVHEQPTLGPKSENQLDARTVFTVEPGLYFPGFGGVRIEDMVVMREGGIQALTTAPKDLIEL